jgi:SHS2 domain-containing protein
LAQLLFSFLQELIFYKDARRLLLHADRVRIEEREGLFRLEAQVSGEQIDAGGHRLLVDVKAVTLHRFQLLLEDRIWKAIVVLDV